MSPSVAAAGARRRTSPRRRPGARAPAGSAATRCRRGRAAAPCRTPRGSRSRSLHARARRAPAAGQGERELLEVAPAGSPSTCRRARHVLRGEASRPFSDRRRQRLAARCVSRTARTIVTGSTAASSPARSRGNVLRRSSCRTRRGLAPPSGRRGYGRVRAVRCQPAGPGSPGNTMRAVSPVPTTRGVTGATSRPAAQASRASAPAKPASCSSWREGGEHRAAVAAALAASAAAGAYHASAIDLLAVGGGTAPGGSGARKNRVSKRIGQLGRRDPARERDERARDPAGRRRPPRPARGPPPRDGRAVRRRDPRRRRGTPRRRA